MLSLPAILREISDYEAAQWAAAFAVSYTDSQSPGDGRIEPAVFKSTRKQLQYQLGQYGNADALAGHRQHGNTFF